MTKLCNGLGVSYSETCLYPSWNAQKLQEVYPWGTIRIPTPEVNVATMNQLSDSEKARSKRSLSSCSAHWVTNRFGRANLSSRAVHSAWPPEVCHVPVI